VASRNHLGPGGEPIIGQAPRREDEPVAIHLGLEHVAQDAQRPVA
jgi:hypothetical protein